MADIKKYIESGIIEAYVMGLTSEGEALEVEAYAASHPEVALAIDQYGYELEQAALANAVDPDPIVKPMVMASVDYMHRLAQGEDPSHPPLLTTASVVEDYTEWLQRGDMKLKEGEKEIFAKIIGFSPEVTTAIVWLKDMAPQEVHHDEYERFLIVEGSCDITIEGEVYSLKPGSFLEIPLHKKHAVKVTSLVACKVLLQRVAA